MKKLIALVLSLIMILSLAACGGSGKDDETLRREDGTKKTSNETPGNPGGASGINSNVPLSFISLLQYAESGDTSLFTPHMLSETEKAQLRASVEAEGGTVDFGADGSITVNGKGGSYFTISLDGSVNGVDDEGNPFGFNKNNKEWPSGAFGKAVPKADLDISMQIEDDESLMIMFENVTYDQAKAYGAKLRGAGFTVDAYETDMKESNMYSFTGKNADDISVEFNYLVMHGSATCALTVSKYSEGYDTYDPYDPYTPSDPGTPGELPAEFKFLLSGNQSGLKVVQHDGYVSVEKDGATVSDARYFASLCASNGLTEQTKQEYDTESGKVFFASYVNGSGDEVHIAYYEDSASFYVDVILSQGQNPYQPQGDDKWPATGVLTKLPKPDFGTGFIIYDYGDQISVTVTGAGASDFAGYAAKVKASGFTRYVDEENDDDLKMYAGYDKDGYGASVQYAYGTFAIVITKQPENFDD